MICSTFFHLNEPDKLLANAMRGDRQLCLAAGMDDYISKPIQLQELAQALSKCPP
ncbi:MAG: hypothetical protein V7K26_07875 [Nostoc sp.]